MLRHGLLGTRGRGLLGWIILCFSLIPFIGSVAIYSIWNSQAANVPLLSGPEATVNQQTTGIINPVIGQMDLLITPQSMSGPTHFRNLLHNGEHLISQRGSLNSATFFGGFTAGCGAAGGTGYITDRWCVDQNNASGTAVGVWINANPTPPPGFSYALKMFRNPTSSSTQQVCAIQEIPSYEIIGLQNNALSQGQSPTVIFSMYAQPGSTLTSVGGLVQAYLFQGTGVDQGLGVLRGAVGMTVSPAITPIWTGLSGGTTPMSAGISSGVVPPSPSWSLGTTAVWTRLWTAPTIVNTATTEAAIAICYTPTGSTAGGTDGFAFTGAQLEPVGQNVFLPSPYEHVSPTIESIRDLRYFWQINETNGTFYAAGACSATNVDSIPLHFMVPMDITPVVSFTAGGLSLVINGASPAGIAGQAAIVPTPQFASLKFTNACTAGQTVLLKGTNTTGSILFSSDY